MKKINYSICIILVISMAFALCKPVNANYGQPEKDPDQFMPKNFITESPDTVERKLYFKLPLLQPEFHWMFKNRKDYLSGKLVISIIRGNKTESITVFENGKISEGWVEMDDAAKSETPERIYFGFISTLKYETAPGDSLRLELNVITDLDGIGPDNQGILKTGTYTSTGVYSLIIDRYDTSMFGSSMSEKELEALHKTYDYTVFMESWKEKWPLVITEGKGWMADPKR